MAVLGEQTGIYDFMLSRIEANGIYNGCRTLDDVKERYVAIDTLYDAIKNGGIHTHLSRDGEPLFGGGGFSRLALAKILELKKILRNWGHPVAAHDNVMSSLRCRD